MNKKVKNSFIGEKPKLTHYQIHYFIIALLIIIIALLYYLYIYYDIILATDYYMWFRPVFFFEYINYCHGLLFCIPLIYSILLNKKKGIVITWLICVIIVFPLAIRYGLSGSRILVNLSIMFLPFALIMILTIERNWRERVSNEMLERDQERKNYTSKILKAQEEERKRIALEIHDGVIQNLIGTANRAQQLSSEIVEDFPEQEKLDWITDSILKTCGDLRKMSLALRPSVLDTKGFISAVKYLLEELEKESTIKTKIMIKGMVTKLSKETENNVFRIVQEALNNIKRHSEATRVEILLDYSHQFLTLKIKDNGKGFNLPQMMDNLNNSGKLGVLGMKYRVELLNGQFDIFSDIGKGTVIAIKLKTNSEVFTAIN